LNAIWGQFSEAAKQTALVELGLVRREPSVAEAVLAFADLLLLLPVEGETVCEDAALTAARIEAAVALGELQKALDATRVKCFGEPLPIVAGQPHGTYSIYARLLADLNVLASHLATLEAVQGYHKGQREGLSPPPLPVLPAGLRDRFVKTAGLLAARCRAPVSGELKVADDRDAAPPLREWSIRLVGEVWHLHWQDEAGEYPQKGNQCVGWLKELLLHPRRFLTAADLVGDPEGKLAGDAKLGSECATDDAGIQAIRRRLEDIEAIVATTGGSDFLEVERAKLLAGLQAADNKVQILSPLKGKHHNIATQLRTFLVKLQHAMPDLAAHLKASLKLVFPHFGYYPPDGTPAWKN
jgi:hypothetical protein